MTDKRKRRPRVTACRRHYLAVRDGLAYRLWGPTGPMWIYRCSVCHRLTRPRELTGGHIQALVEGGSNHSDNLRAECARCNELENIGRQKAKNPARTRMRLERGLIRARRHRVKGEIRAVLFENIPVYFEGRLLSMTSEERAESFVRLGHATRDPDGAVRLLQPPRNNEPARKEPIPNACVRCGTTEHLRLFSIYPSWHPSYRVKRVTEKLRPTCIDCFDVFLIGYAIEITRTALPVLEEHWRLIREARDRKATAVEAYSRSRAGKKWPERLAALAERQFGIRHDRTSLEKLEALAIQTGRAETEAKSAIFEAVGRAVQKAGLDFDLLFDRIVRREIDPSNLDIPQVPQAVMES